MKDNIITTKQYVRFMLVMLIPVISYIFCIDSMRDKDKSEAWRNLCRAFFILKSIVIVVIVILCLMFLSYQYGIYVSSYMS